MPKQPCRPFVTYALDKYIDGRSSVFEQTLDINRGFSLLFKLILLAGYLVRLQSKILPKIFLGKLVQSSGLVLFCFI